MAFKKLRKGRLSEGQIKLAESIRNGLVNRYPWGMDTTQADRTMEKLRKITSALFYIESKALLQNNHVIVALRQYEEKNYQRRAGFKTN